MIYNLLIIDNSIIENISEYFLPYFLNLLCTYKVTPYTSPFIKETGVGSGIHHFFLHNYINMF